MKHVRDLISEFIVQNFYVPDALGLDDEVSLIERGIIDSTGVLELTAFLEREFGIRVADDEMVADNLDTIGRIAAFVGKKRQAAA
jgi:acyl carrier protein